MADIENNNEVATEMTEEEIQEAKDRLNELEGKLKSLEEIENKQIEALKKLTNFEMENKIKELQDQVKDKLDSRMSHVEDRYEEHAMKAVDERQTDILRMNKVIREVSRKLPTDIWGTLYDSLTFDLENKDFVVSEKNRIEQARPFMQAYMCLTSWRDQCGDRCDISRLTTALKDNGQGSLADISEEILKSTGDSLFTFNGVYRKSTNVKDKRVPRPMSVILSSLEDLNAAKPKLSRECSMRVKNEQIEGFLGNRILLKVSRQFKSHDHWKALAKNLNFSDEDITDIDSKEDDSMTCTFKMLFAWRETLKPLTAEHVQRLENELTKIDKKDAIEAMNT